VGIRAKFWEKYYFMSILGGERVRGERSGEREGRVIKLFFQA